MRPRDLCTLFALVSLPALASQDPAAYSSADSKFRRAKFRHDVLLRDGDGDQATFTRVSFPLPPGGHELDLQPTSFTPYDRYFTSVRSVVASMEPHPSY